MFPRCGVVKSIFGWKKGWYLYRHCRTSMNQGLF